MFAAATPDATVPPTQDSSPAPAAPSGFIDGLGNATTLLGDIGGLRPALAERGMTLGIQETSEVLGNATGGVRRGAAYDGLTTVTLQLDTQKAFGWAGGSFNASALNIHGRNLSADNLGTLQTASGIQADRATRLWELWYQQTFLAEERLDVRAGLQSLDQEFITSQGASTFINTAFGWPMLPTADLPGGGPAYPLASPGVRVRFRPTDSVTILAGVFNGSPVGNNSGDPQKQNPSGVSFPLHGGQLAIAEIQYGNGAGAAASPGEAKPLGWLYKFGVYYDSERFADPRYDSAGRSLSSPLSTGDPRQHRGNLAIYAVADQAVWRSGTDPDQSVSVFFRGLGTPYGDRNLIDYSFNVGATLHSPFAGRGSDTAGLALGFAHVASHISGADRDSAFFSGVQTPVRFSETFIEATYQFQATPWLQLQPDAQYVFNPGAGGANPSTGRKLKNELVLGLRTTVIF